jgi:hypothetical protein
MPAAQCQAGPRSTHLYWVMDGQTDMTFTHGILYYFIQDYRKSGMFDMRILNYKIYTK